MTSFSSISDPIVSLNLSEPLNANSSFNYNYYTYDESTNSTPVIPDVLKISSNGQLDTKTPNFSVKIPRFITLNWTYPGASGGINENKKFLISDHLNDIVTEDNFISLNNVSYSFSTTDDIIAAQKNFNDQNLISDSSQATAIDNYVSNLLQNYVETGNEPNALDLRNRITTAISNIEMIADNSANTLGITYTHVDSNQSIINFSAFDKLISRAPFLHTQINAFVLPDLFISSSLEKYDLKKINDFYVKNQQKNKSFSDPTVHPIFVGEIVQNVEIFSPIILYEGYVIEKYEITETGRNLIQIIPIESPTINNYIDPYVKYGSSYSYLIRTVASIKTAAYNEEDSTIREITYLISSRPASTQITCFETVPPPPPVDIDFIWNYKKNKLMIVWNMPLNSQRDITQFQVLRRSSIKEPFQLLKQYCFDYSTKKYLSGENIDGNKIDMNPRDSLFVESSNFPIKSHVDNEFKKDIELLQASKYIYALASVDAHGIISNYSAQFEVTFDFFKNKLITKLISLPGAPRQYPNLYLEVDTFKDTIQARGEFSKNLKIYFMPEYFKLQYANKTVQRMVATKQLNSFYKIQFINTQNQKSDSVKIVINDPQNLVYQNSQ
jgi:hypothetical protein